MGRQGQLYSPGEVTHVETDGHSTVGGCAGPLQGDRVDCSERALLPSREEAPRQQERLQRGRLADTVRPREHADARRRPLETLERPEVSEMKRETCHGRVLVLQTSATGGLWCGALGALAHT